MLGARLSAFADDNLLLNGDLRATEHNLPAHWNPYSRRPDRTNANFSWRPGVGNGQLRIAIDKWPDYATWSQTVRTSPGWYCLSGEIRASGLHPGRDNAMFGVQVGPRSFGWPPDPLRPSQWTEGTVYFKVGGPIEEVSVICKLRGLPASVSCRKLSLTRLNSPPPSGARAFDFQSAAEAELVRERALGPKPSSSSSDGTRVSFNVPAVDWNGIARVLLLTVLVGSVLLISTLARSFLRGSLREDIRSLIANRTLLASVGLPIFFVALVAAFARISLVFPKNSDDAIFILQAQDMLSGNFLLHGWTQGTESFYTTIIPFYLAGSLFVKDMGVLMYVIPPVIYALLVCLWVKITLSSVAAPYRLTSALIVFLIIALPSSFAPGPPIENGHDHITTTLFVGLSFFLLAKAEHIVLASLALIVACIGDPFALWVGIVPIALVGGYHLLLADWRRGAKLLGVALVSVLISQLATMLIPMLGGYDSTPQWGYFVQLEELPRNFYLFAASVLTLFGADFFGHYILSLTTVNLLAHLAVMGLIFFLIGRATMTWWRNRTIDLLVELLIVSIVIDIAAFIFSNAPENNYIGLMGAAGVPGHLDWSVAQYLDWSGARFLSPMLLFGALVAGISWYSIESARRYIGYPLTAIALCYVTAFVAQMLQPVAPVPRVVDFLEARNLDEGYGSYWCSGIFTVLSRGKVKVRQVEAGPEGKLEPLRWVSASKWYDTDGARFVIFRDPDIGVDLKEAVETWGPPSSVERIEDYYVAVWTRPIHVAN